MSLAKPKRRDVKKAPTTGDGEYTEEETARRRDAAMRKAMNTPPKPHAEMKVGRKAKTKAGKSPVKRKTPRSAT